LNIVPFQFNPQQIFASGSNRDFGGVSKVTFFFPFLFSGKGLEQDLIHPECNIQSIKRNRRRFKVNREETSVRFGEKWYECPADSLARLHPV
jgi:hypothetical protein